MTDYKTRGREPEKYLNERTGGGSYSKPSALGSQGEGSRRRAGLRQRTHSANDGQQRYADPSRIAIGGNVARPLRLGNAPNDLAFHRLERPLDDLIDIRKVPATSAVPFASIYPRGAFAPPFAAV